MQNHKRKRPLIRMVMHNKKRRREEDRQRGRVQRDELKHNPKHKHQNQAQEGERTQAQWKGAKESNN